MKQLKKMLWIVFGYFQVVMGQEIRNKANDKRIGYLLLEDNYITTDQKSNYNEISFMLCSVVEFEILNHAPFNSKRH